MECEESKICNKCGRLVSGSEVSTHESYCTGIGEFSHQYARTTGFSAYSEFNFDNDYHTYDDTRRVKLQTCLKSYATVKCPKCKYLYTISEYYHHRACCNYTICVYCDEYFPRFLMDHHAMVCPHREHIETMIEDVSESGYTNNNALSEDNPLNNAVIYESFNRFMAIDPSFDRPYEFAIDNIGPIITSRNSNRAYGLNMNRLQNIIRVPQRVGIYRRLRSTHNENDIVDLLDHRAFVMINRLFARDVNNIVAQFMLLFQDPVRGLTESNIQKLETVKYIKPGLVPEGEEDKCPICIVCFEHEETIRKLPCCHFFHPNCIDTWLVQNSLCPICKNDLNQYFEQAN